MADKQQYYYLTTQSSELGQQLVRLTHRIDEVMQAADSMAVEMRAYEWSADPRYVAGGIYRLVFKNPPKAKKALMVVGRDNDGNYECAPNPDYNRGLRLAKKMASLPHVTDDEVCQPFGFDPHDPQYKNHLIPQFFIVGDEWVYVHSTFELSCADLTPCLETTFEAALKFVEEQESPTLLVEEE